MCVCVCVCGFFLHVWTVANVMYIYMCMCMGMCVCLCWCVWYMIHLYVLAHTCAITHTFVTSDLRVFVLWLVHMCDILCMWIVVNFRTGIQLSVSIPCYLIVRSSSWYVAVCCSGLQCVAVRCIVLQWASTFLATWLPAAAPGVLQWVAVCCSVM